MNRRGLWMLKLGLIVAAVCAACAVSGVDAGEAELVPAKLFVGRGGLGNVFAKLKGDGAVKVAYFGGSITAQAGWRVKTLKWFRETWPGAKVDEINAAIGGTGSDLGAFRCRQDVIVHKPDLVFVEFAVNDGGAAPEHIYRTMEGIVRQIWTADAECDICFVYTIHQNMMKDYERGLCSRSASAMERLADHYGIPSITMALRVAQLRKEDKLVFSVPRGQKPPEGKIGFSNDSCHPTDAGHEVFLEVIVQALKEFQKHGAVGPHKLPEPYRKDNWANARMVPIAASMLTDGWAKLPKDKGLGKRFARRLPEIWEARKPGEKLTFRFKGTMARLYDLLGPDGGIAICSVDGKEVRRSKRFDWYCTYHRLASLTVAGGLEAKEHTVVVEVSPDEPDREVVLKRVRDQANFDPKRYQGTVLRFGYIMVLGEVLGK